MTEGDAGPTEPLAYATGERPELGDENRLVLMAVDPYVVFAYWNVTPKRMEAALALFEADELEGYVLRFHDTTGVDFDGVNSWHSFDVSVRPEARQWYVRLWSPEKRYCADYGLRGKDGRLVALVRSNMVETAPDWPHVRVDDTAVVMSEAAETAEPAVTVENAGQAEPPAIPGTILEQPTPPSAATAPGRPRREPSPSGNGSLAEDLTQMSEENFTPGISSVVLGARRPRK